MINVLTFITSLIQRSSERGTKPTLITGIKPISKKKLIYD